MALEWAISSKLVHKSEPPELPKANDRILPKDLLVHARKFDGDEIYKAVGEEVKRVRLKAAPFATNWGGWGVNVGGALTLGSWQDILVTSIQRTAEGEHITGFRPRAIT